MRFDRDVQIPDPERPPQQDAPAPDTTAAIDAAIAAFRRLAFHEVTFEVVAAELGTDVSVVHAAFPSWNGMLIAVVDRWQRLRMSSVAAVPHRAGTAAFLRRIVEVNAEDPALMRFLTAMSHIAATPGHPLAPMLFQRWAAFHQQVQDSLARDIETGLEPDTMDPARGAEQLVAMYEGLQLQSMVRRDMDVLESYDRAVTRLREGWSRAYVPPVWNLGAA